MPDFARLLRQKLRQRDGPGGDEIIQELADHMEDRYEELRREGRTPRGAFQATVEEAGDWQQLRREILSARRQTMTDWAKRIRIPGIVALLVFTVGERLLWHLRVGTPYVFLYWSWLTGSVPMFAVALVAGAAGAVCSLYAGGSKRQRVWAAEFPVLCLLALYLGFLLFHLLTQILWGHAIPWRMAMGLVLRNVVFGALLPSVGLFLGALPLLASSDKSRRVETTAC